MNYKSLNDSELYLLLSEGKSKDLAFKEIYSRYSKKIYFYCKKMLGDDKTAEDVFQDVFVALLKTVERKSELENLKAYLFRIAGNLSLNIIRKNKIRKIEYKDIFELDFYAKSDYQDNESAETAKLINSALELLSDDYKEAFTLQMYFNMSYNEISEITEVPVSTVRNRVVRAKLKLRQILSPYFEVQKSER